MINWETLLIGALGLFIGYKLNQYANQKTEQKIIDSITAKIEELASKITPEQARVLQSLRNNR